MSLKSVVVKRLHRGRPQKHDQSQDSIISVRPKESMRQRDGIRTLTPPASKDRLRFCCPEGRTLGSIDHHKHSCPPRCCVCSEIGLCPWREGNQTVRRYFTVLQSKRQRSRSAHHLPSAIVLRSMTRTLEFLLGLDHHRTMGVSFSECECREHT